MTINELRKIATTKGVTIGTQRDMYGWSYWLLDANGNDLFEDDNFYTSTVDIIDAVKNLVEAPKYFVEKWISQGMTGKEFFQELDQNKADHLASDWHLDCAIEWRKATV